MAKVKPIDPTDVRPLHEIARDIKANWPKVYFGAVPYLNALFALDTIHDEYIADSAADMVRYFLANANTWRGEDARRVKAELNSMLAALDKNLI